MEKFSYLLSIFPLLCQSNQTFWQSGILFSVVDLNVEDKWFD